MDGKLTREQYDAAKKETLDTPDKKPGQMPAALRIHMPHGSLCLMVGKKVQYLYQVSFDHDLIKCMLICS
jgi:hypothetical protein